MSCIRPCAPAGLGAFGSKPDSCWMTAQTSAGSTPYFVAAAWISAAYGVALVGWALTVCASTLPKSVAAAGAVRTVGAKTGDGTESSTIRDRTLSMLMGQPAVGRSWANLRLDAHGPTCGW